jgi:TolB-like protein/DNA-binding winged helix-turn-helix (wHTH) protein
VRHIHGVLRRCDKPVSAKAYRERSLGVATIKIGEAHVDFAALSIEGPAGQFSIESKVMSLLQVLVDEAGTVVSRADLLSRVWGENFGGDESLSRAVSLLRRAFGEVRGGHQYIETVPKRGYRLIASVELQGHIEALAAPDLSVTVQPPELPFESGAQSPIAVAKQRWLLGLLALVAVAAGLYLFASTAENRLKPVQFAEEGAAEEMAAAAGVKSIAVLPFKDLSAGGDQQFLADGLAEEILNVLVRFADLKVIGRTSSFSYRQSEPDLGEIYSTFAVSHVLTGSLRKQGSQLRVTARVVSTENGSNLWSQTYDGDVTDIFDLQEDIAQQIAQSLGLVLDLDSNDRISSQLTANREAYELFLQGRALARKFGHRNKSKARDLLGRAVVADPGFAAAWAWLGQANFYLTLTAQSSQIPGLVSSARHAVERALSLDPELAMGHYVRTILLDYELDFAASVDAVEKAYALNPSQPYLEIRRGYYQGLIGRSTRGVALMRQGLVSDPTDSVGLLNLGVATQALGDLEQANSLLQRSEDLGFEPAAGQICNLLSYRQKPEAAYQCWVELPFEFRSRYSPLFQNQQQWAALGSAAFLGEEDAREMVTAALDTYFSEPGSRANSYLLQVYLIVGGAERFMRTFVSHPYPLNAGAITIIWDEHPAHRLLRQHPDFPAFAERIGLLRAWQKYGWPDRCHPLSGGDGSGGQFHCD